ncbi:MAG: TonB-dependent receptor, partial [Haliscomenobacter sp.]
PARKWKLQANATVSQNKIIALDDYLDKYVTDPGSGEVNWEGQHVVARTHTDLAFSPDLIAGADCTVQPFAGAGWLEKRELELSWQSRYVGRQFIDNASDPLNALAPYSFTNLRLRYAGNPSEKGRIELTLLLQNVFKARYASNAWSYRYRYDGATYVDQGFFPQAGRHFLLGLTVRW